MSPKMRQAVGDVGNWISQQWGLDIPAQRYILRAIRDAGVYPPLTFREIELVAQNALFLKNDANRRD